MKHQFHVKAADLQSQRGQRVQKSRKHMTLYSIDDMFNFLNLTLVLNNSLPF